MNDPTHSNSNGSAPSPLDVYVPSPDVHLDSLASLLTGVDADTFSSATNITCQDVASESEQNRLAQVRLGIANGLFSALRAKHPPSAAHALRVAMDCSVWALARNMPTTDRDELEVASLLHDIGRIGVPDSVLLKPQRLDEDEVAAMDHRRALSLDILESCCASAGILRCVRYAHAWYDGSAKSDGRCGEDLPLGSRMISIVSAFDSMTTDHVYRPSMPQEVAMAELFECAGTQFDPQLVREFCDLQPGIRSTPCQRAAVRRWLTQLVPEKTDSWWKLTTQEIASTPSVTDLFSRRLVDNTYDAIVFVDVSMKILHWNAGAERMTGISANGVLHQHWMPGLFGMRGENGQLISAEECPIRQAIRSGVQTLRRLTIMGRSGEDIFVNAHTIPVVGKDGTLHGASLQLHDASSETTLEHRVQVLHEKAIRDPLTQLANRAEFDRSLEQLVRSHLEKGQPCSLIMCDIDHFKRANDTYGHQAGDEALVSFASLLQRSCRPGDMVARYGGEEFVMLCADCDSVIATNKAEEIRRELAGIAQPMLNGHHITASFGVTELQPGDTPETILRRADRGLLQAKSYGRNVVIQLGSGLTGNKQSPPPRPRGWIHRLLGSRPAQVLEQCVITTMPLKVVVGKLRGFITDHHAEIELAEEDRLALTIGSTSVSPTRRSTDRPMPFFVEMTFSEVQDKPEGAEASGKQALTKTHIQVVIRPCRNRDRRSNDVAQRARQILVSLKSYLMVHEYHNAPISTKGSSETPKE